MRDVFGSDQQDRGNFWKIRPRTLQFSKCGFLGLQSVQAKINGLMIPFFFINIVGLRLHPKLKSLRELAFPQALVQPIRIKNLLFRTRRGRRRKAKMKLRLQLSYCLAPCTETLVSEMMC